MLTVISYCIAFSKAIFKGKKSVFVVPIYKNKRGIQSCPNHRGIKLTSPTIKSWKKGNEAKTKTREKDIWKSIWFYAREVNYECYLLAYASNEKILRGKEKSSYCLYWRTQDFCLEGRTIVNWKCQSWFCYTFFETKKKISITSSIY